MTRGSKICLAIACAVAVAFCASTAFGQAQDKNQQKCITKLNKSGTKVAAAQGKDNFKCIAFAGKGKLAKLGATNPQECLTTDLKEKVLKKKQKTQDFETKFCIEPEDIPDFGVPAATVGSLAQIINDAAMDQEIAMVADVFGPDLDTSVVSCDDDKDACKCQQKVIKDMEKLAAAKLKEFIKCKKFALKDKGKLPFPNGATSAADLETCVDDAGTPGSIANDAKGKILKKADKIAKDAFKKCANAKGGPVDISTAFPGQCASESAAGGETVAANDFARCVDERVECRVCLMINAMDGLNVDCDVFDDGDGGNDSCPPGALPPVCPLTPGEYTLTQVSGGSLAVDGLPAFPFPAGGTIVQDVGTGDANCVHGTVVPFPGGFSAPVFCIPALGFTTAVVQTGCGIGAIDSNGGSDFTVTEIGDTSAPNCAPPLTHVGCTPGGDSSLRVDISIGDSVADTCGSGTANSFVSVPVFTTTWQRIGMCPDPDGTYDPGTDNLIVAFAQTLDFTTDSTLADWGDLDPDGCCLAGAGPGSFTNPCTPGGPGGFSGSGTCIDLTGLDVGGADVTTVAAGTIGSSGFPLFDLTFLTTLPNEISTSGAFSGVTCASPPILPAGFVGSATRCIP